MGNPPATLTEGDVECFSEYMEVWVHRMRIEGLRLWLSGALRIQVVSLASLDHLNLQFSACGFSLHKDPDKNYIFRVMYNGCFVQHQQHGSNVLVLNLVKRINRFGDRTHSFIMKCPMVPAPPNREHIQCDPDDIQVIRQIPLDSWNNEVMERTGEFLALKLVSGQYAYSMEATCPNVVSVSSPAAEDTILHIFKRRMGLTKRGGYESDTLTVSSVSVKQTEKFTVHETHDFVQLSIATALILQVKETNHKMYWTMENTLPCTESPRLLSISPIYYHTSTTSDPILTYTTSTPASYTTVPFSSYSTMDQQFLSTEKSQEGPSTFPKTTSIERTQAEETGRNTSPTSSSHTQTSGPIIYWSNVTSMTPSTTNKATKDKYQQTSTISEATQVEFQGTTATSATVQVEFQGTTVTSETALVEFQGPTSTTDTIQSRFQGTSGSSETVQEEFQATTIASGTMHVEFQETTITSETARVEFQGTTTTSETA
ncbi:unnamed protein product, partial [Coregonus sp. 'balchen']